MTGFQEINENNRNYNLHQENDEYCLHCCITFYNHIQLLQHVKTENVCTVNSSRPGRERIATCILFSEEKYAPLGIASKCNDCHLPFRRLIIFDAAKVI